VDLDVAGSNPVTRPNHSIIYRSRRTDPVRWAHIEAQYHLPLRPGTNVAILNALAHVA
jgi:anaerobic selenocysteine-containing dehydrogenase